MGAGTSSGKGGSFDQRVAQLTAQGISESEATHAVVAKQNFTKDQLTAQAQKTIKGLNKNSSGHYQYSDPTTGHRMDIHVFNGGSKDNPSYLVSVFDHATQKDVFRSAGVKSIQEVKRLLHQNTGIPK